ncbi:MAG: ABC transporter permease [Alphaproteobacteria bacterium]|nr:ABC transporter permease [Alphaproteobacteria bacterium]
MAEASAHASVEAAPRRPWPLVLTIGLALVGLVIGVALLSFFWTPQDPNRLNVRARLMPAGSPGYPLGTDKLGRDVLTQIIVGARNSLYVSIVATLFSLVVGAALGLATAAAGPRWQSVVTRIVDVGVAIPGILVALVVATALEPGNTASIIAIVSWFIPLAARVTIGPARQVLALDFVEAAFAYGRGRIFVLLNHVLPNIGPTLIVQASVMFAAGILAEAALSFIGVGAQPPTSSWGRLLKEAQPLIDVAPSLMISPGLAIMTAVLGFNLLGDGLRSYLDPKQTAVGGGA